MSNLIPSIYHYETYIYLCLFLLVFTLIHALILRIHDLKNVAFINTVGYSLLVFFILFIGQREITSRYGFGDTANYYKAFDAFSKGAPIKEVKDLGWQLFMKSLATFTTAHTFFTICAFLYIFPLYKVSKAYFKEYWYYCFFAFLVSFSFYTYGVNGVRNGVAGSLFLWGLCYKDKKWLMILLFAWAIMFHKTITLPVIAYLLTYLYNNPKSYLIAWFVAIPLSLVMGSVWIGIFASLGFDDRLSGYLAGSTTGTTSFRWDFIFYSSFAVFAGWYFIFKKKFKDRFYNQLLNTYLICNAFWILVIRANFSNRFAYLSWFMMAIVIFYPFLKTRLFKNHHLTLAKVLIAYFMFTFLMFFIYYADKR
ncbi:EpsG family protein [Seonamhaeicola algicola]|uniref:EpsG family protein n=1 Tax=Seonamhaeicola algicola TaxID=1719036 RepID=A0A5C7AVG8_9FLAO|nr:EpsG family protein [Seonamhaeicola algicola]TXE11663.1 EpsG family protein [Seonamhaeicola algicola]